MDALTQAAADNKGNARFLTMSYGKFTYRVDEDCVNDKILLLTSELYEAKKYYARGAAEFLLKRYEEKNLISQGATVVRI